MNYKQAAIGDMNSDKAAGLDGYGIEVEKYIAGARSQFRVGVGTV